jgi:hypothetical protein
MRHIRRARHIAWNICGGVGLAGIAWFTGLVLWVAFVRGVQTRRERSR